MEISKRLEGSKKQTNLSMNEHLNITPIQIILSYQAQPQTNNLDKLENPNTPPHKNEYQSPPRNPINPTSRTHTINHYRERQKAHVHKLSNPPPQNLSQDPRRVLESLAKENPQNHDDCNNPKIGTRRRRPRRG